MIKVLIVVGASICLLAAIITAGVSYNAYTNRNRPHVFTAEEIFVTECAKRGGNPITKEGSKMSNEDGRINTQEYTCEGVNNVRN